MDRLRISTAALLLLTSSTSAFALSDEIDAVVRFCGTPKAEDRRISQVTNRLQRDLIYNDLILHFQPLGSGWSFTTAWHGHLPMTRTELEQRLPCFHQAMATAAVTSHPSVDPAIAGQVATPPIDDSTFGIQHLWLILLLAVAITVFAVMVPARKRRRTRIPQQGSSIPRPYRKPRLIKDLPKRRHLGDLDD